MCRASSVSACNAIACSGSSNSSRVERAEQGPVHEVVDPLVQGQRAEDRVVLLAEVRVVQQRRARLELVLATHRRAKLDEVAIHRREVTDDDLLRAPAGDRKDQREPVLHVLGQPILAPRIAL